MSRKNITKIATLILCVIIMVVLVAGTRDVAIAAGAQGSRVLKETIMRAAVLCYANEGFYPPSLAYIEENYYVSIDYTRYTVRYEVFAVNVMPKILVSEKQ